MAHFVDMAVRLKVKGVANASDYLTSTMSKQQGGSHGGSVTLLRPDGTQFPGSPFKSAGLPGPWAASVDGNDNVWISNFASPSSPIVELCGVRVENCPPGMKTGGQISPPGGYVGGGLQMQTDIDCRPRRQCLGNEQLAGHRQLYRHTARGLLDALRRTRRCRLLWDGQARAGAPNRPSSRSVNPAARPGPRFWTARNAGDRTGSIQRLVDTREFVPDGQGAALAWFAIRFRRAGYTHGLGPMRPGRDCH